MKGHCKDTRRKTTSDIPPVIPLCDQFDGQERPLAPPTTLNSPTFPSTVAPTKPNDGAFAGACTGHHLPDYDGTHDEDNPPPITSAQYIVESDIQRICFHEFFQPNSCPRNPKCPFTHNIQPELRSSQVLINKIKGIQATIKRRRGRVNRF